MIKKIKNLLGLLLLTFVLSTQASEYLVPSTYSNHGFEQIDERKIVGGVNDGVVVATHKLTWVRDVCPVPFPSLWFCLRVTETWYANNDYNYNHFWGITENSIVKKISTYFGPPDENGVVHWATSWGTTYTLKNGTTYSESFSGIFTFWGLGVPVSLPSENTVVGAYRQASRIWHMRYYDNNGVLVLYDDGTLERKSRDFITYKIVVNSSVGPFINGQTYNFLYQHNGSGAWQTVASKYWLAPSSGSGVVTISVPWPTLPPITYAAVTAENKGFFREIAIIP